MADFKFIEWTKGWIHHNQHLIGLDGFTNVNNFCIYNNAIEKVRGYKKIILHSADAPIDSFTGEAGLVIDDIDDIIDSFS
jgi:hypothetical protein